MTTIAANLETMAADSKVMLDSGVSYRTIKITRVKKMIVGAAGDGGDCTRVLEWAERDFKDPKPKWASKATDDQAFWALILKPDGLYFLTQDDPHPEKMDEPHFAIGSGGKAARLAMNLGKTPEEAVALACQVDENSGLPVQVLSLKDHSTKG